MIVRVVRRTPAPLLFELLLLGGEIHGGHVSARTPREAGHVGTGDGLAFDDAGTKWLWESERRDAEVSLEVFDDTFREGEGLCLIDDLLFRQIVGDQELSHVAHNLARRGHFDDVAEQAVGNGVALLHGGPLSRESQLGGLIQQVGVLPTRHFVDVNVSRATLLAALEGSIKATAFLPVLVDFGNILQCHAGVEITAGRTRNERAKRRLGRHS